MDVNPKCWQKRLRFGPIKAAGVLAGCALLGTWAAQAQVPPQALPGITIVQPPPSMPSPNQAGQMMVNPMMQPPPPPMQAPAPPPAAAPKPKPKVAARPRGETADDAPGPGKGGSGTRIAILVNGDPITAYELEQRTRLMALSSDIQSRAQENMKRLATSEAVTARWKQIVQETIQAHQHNKTRDQIIALIQEKQKAYSLGLQKQAVDSARAAAINQPDLRNKAREELIDEMIKMQDARRVGSAPDDAMVEDLIKDLAQRNGKTPKEFAQHFAAMGVDVATLKSRFRAQLAWTEAIRKQFSHLASPNNRDLDLVGVDIAGEDQVELQLHRIVIPVPAKVDQKVMAQRLAEAEGLQGQFKGCRTTAGLAAKVQGARFENMGMRRASTFTGVSKTMLVNAQEDTMIPPTMTSGGIELLAVCSKRVIKAVDIKRNEKANEIRQEKFELHSRAHLRRLRNDAVIETR